MVMTVYWTKRGFTEANPFMNWLLNEGSIYFVLSKILVSLAIMGCIAPKWEITKKVGYFVYVTTGIYLLLTAWHIYGIVKFGI